MAEVERRVLGEWARGRAGARVIRLAVRVARADAEAVLAELLALAPGGLEEREVGGGRGGVVLYGAPGELPDLGDVRAAAGGGARWTSPRSEIPDDWSERWKAFHRPSTSPGASGGCGCARRGSRRSTRDGIDLVIDPGQAFGTGAHHTTRLCLELLLELEPAGALADWGCGTGVLAIAAARLGGRRCSPATGRRRPSRRRAENAAVNGAPASR